MKAIDHPVEGLKLVSDETITDASVTYPFVDAEAPQVGADEVAVAGLALVAGAVHRTWSVETAPGYDIPVAEILRRIDDSELAMWLSSAYPGCNIPLAVAHTRILAQTALHSQDPRVVAALPGFNAMFGAERVKELLAP